MLDTRANKVGQSLPDPWELPAPAADTRAAGTWQLPGEPHPLMTGAGSPEAPSLPAVAAHPEQILLQDWLKLRALQGRDLAARVAAALGLLYWSRLGLSES
jgi:hypothetical protein